MLHFLYRPAQTYPRTAVRGGGSPGQGLQYEYEAEKQSHAQLDQVRGLPSIVILVETYSSRSSSDSLFHVPILRTPVHAKPGRSELGRPYSIPGANRHAPAPAVGVVAAVIGIARRIAVTAALADIHAVIAVSPPAVAVVVTAGPAVAIACRPAVVSGSYAAGIINRSTVTAGSETRRTSET